MPKGPEFSPESIAKLNRERNVNDAKKVAEGAKYVTDPGVPEPRLEFTKEQVEVAHKTEVASAREKLLASYGNEDASGLEERKRVEQATEDRIVITNASRRLIDLLQALFSSLARNKFPRVGFDSSELVVAITKDAIDEKAITGALANISRLLNRISVPEDFQDRMEIRPENYRAVIRILEELKDDLVFLRNAFNQAKSQNLENLSTKVNRIRGVVEKKINSMSDFLRLRQRVSDRGY